MLSVARQSAKTFIRGNLTGSCYVGRTFVASTPRKTPVTNGFTVLRRFPSQLQSLLRQTGTVAVSYTSRAAPKSKKIVGTWMLTCSGMVFIAVALGIVGYVFVYCCVRYVVKIVADQTYGK